MTLIDDLSLSPVSIPDKLYAQARAEGYEDALTEVKRLTDDEIKRVYENGRRDGYEAAMRDAALIVQTLAKPDPTREIILSAFVYPYTRNLVLNEASRQDIGHKPDGGV